MKKKITKAISDKIVDALPNNIPDSVLKRAESLASIMEGTDFQKGVGLASHMMDTKTLTTDEHLNINFFY